MNSERMNNDFWYKSAVSYEVAVRAFKDSNCGGGIRGRGFKPPPALKGHPPMQEQGDHHERRHPGAPGMA